MKRRQLVASIVISTPILTQAYLGPTPCDPDHEPLPFQPSPRGYSSFSHLLFDLSSLSTQFHSGQQVNEALLKFCICPGSTIDLDDSTLPLSFIPIRLPGVTIQCGERGRRGSNPKDRCIIRGGGKRSPTNDKWTTDRASSYKDGGHAILGGGNVAQIYVYGDDAYEVTLRGLTMDNSLSRAEIEMYGAFVQEFGVDALWGDDDDDVLTGAAVSGAADTGDNNFGYGTNAGTGSTLNTNINAKSSGNRKLQNYDAWDTFDVSSTITEDKVEAMDSIEPAHRYASVAVRGGGYGDDPGPRIITIEDCEFIAHRGYAVLISPGIKLPEIPVAPNGDMPEQPNYGTTNMNQDNGKPHNYGTTGSNMNQDGNGLTRKLGLLDGEAKFISQQGSVKYFDNSAGTNYLDGRRVKIVDSEFTNNDSIGDQVAGLVTSAYSITISKCKFGNNSGKSLVYVYNNQALIDNTVFAQNSVKTATVVLKSPEGSTPKSKDDSTPDHLVEKSCFIGSKVGMSNVLVTDIVNTGFGQRDNHATGTEFSWDSKCEGAATEENGEDCLQTGICDGTCVEFISERCLSEIHDESNQQSIAGMFMWNGDTFLFRQINSNSIMKKYSTILLKVLHLCQSAAHSMAILHCLLCPDGALVVVTCLSCVQYPDAKTS
eukprot:scaffold22098_cov76-Cyclotella_meneghiniana.AAC.14